LKARTFFQIETFLPIISRVDLAGVIGGIVAAQLGVASE
jgi:hypothetical protein